MSALVWTEEKKANEECSYNHTIAVTPFGRFLLSWKGWREVPYHGIGFDETPWGDAWYDYWDTAEEAKIAAEERYQTMLKKELDKFNNSGNMEVQNGNV